MKRDNTLKNSGLAVGGGKQRLDYLDLLKGIAIFLMVMGHFLAWNIKSDGSGMSSCMLIKNLIYSFHMPLFFFISGYLIDMKNKVWTSSLVINVFKKRFLTLIVPGLTTMFVSHLLFSGWYFEWFLRAMFVVMVSFSMVKWISCTFKFSIWAEILIHGVIFGIVLYFIRNNSDVCDTWLVSQKNWNNYIYFVLGALFCKYPSVQSSHESKRMVYSVVSVAYIILFYVRNYVFQIGALSFIVALCGIYIALYLGKQANFENKIVKAFVLMGKNSLAIYILSNFFIPSIPGVNDLVHSSTGVTSVGLQIAFGTVVTSYVCIMCLFVDSFFKKSIILNFLYHGKW